METLYLVGTGKTREYGIADVEKLQKISAEFGISITGKNAEKLAAELGRAMLEEYGMVKNTLQLLNRAPKATRDIWTKLGISPRGIDREVVDCMHRVQMGVGADYTGMLLQGLRCSLADGWGGTMMGTDISDVLFGTPTIKTSTMNLAVMKADHVNISVHGHNPVLSEAIVKAVADPLEESMATENPPPSQTGLTAPEQQPPPPAPQAPLPQAAPAPAVQTNALALVSMIMGVLGFLLFCAEGVISYLVYFSILVDLGAVICGHISPRQIKRSQGRQTGGGVAIVGLVLGYLLIAGEIINLLGVVLINYAVSTLWN